MAGNSVLLVDLKMQPRKRTALKFQCFFSFRFMVGGEIEFGIISQIISWLLQK